VSCTGSWTPCSASRSELLHSRSTDERPTDVEVLTRQLGRPPRSPWSVAVRCGYGRPSVIRCGPILEGGEPFPTLMWLSCPWLVESVGRQESAGEAAAWKKRLAGDASAARRLLEADSHYRRMRARCAGGSDPCADVGIAGQSDPLATKCLHAHVATFLAGLDDPVGEAVFGSIHDSECPDDRCAPHPDRESRREPEVARR